MEDYLQKYYSKKYPNYSILKQMAIDSQINGSNIENIMSNNSKDEWLEGVKKWYTMNLNRHLTTEQVFHTLFMCLDDLKKGEETYSKQPINKGAMDLLYEVPSTAPFVLVQMLITPNYHFVSKKQNKRNHTTKNRHNKRKTSNKNKPNNTQKQSNTK